MKNRLLLFLLLTSWVHLQAQSVRYVAADGSGDGSSWANASNDIQAMINASAELDEVWVAAGIFKPNDYPSGCSGCTTARDFTFQMKNGVSLYGGFAGNELNKESRDIASNPTILSGDIGMEAESEDNVHHVIIGLDADFTLDGFILEAGNANINSSITVNEITLSRQIAGAAFLRNGNVILRNNIIRYNFGQLFTGGVRYVSDNNGVFIAERNEFSHNTNVGALTIQTAQSELTDNVFINNSSVSSTGALYIDNGSSVLTNNDFIENTAQSSGGAILVIGGDHQLINNYFFRNQANNAGAVAFNNGTIYFRDNRVIENSAQTSSAGIAIVNCEAQIYNNIFSTNIGGTQGGAISTLNSTSTYINNTFYANRAGLRGGAFFNIGGNHTLVNNIFWANQKVGGSSVIGADLESSVDIPGVVQVSYCLTQPNSIYSSGTGIINNQNPLFEDPPTYNFGLTSCSPAIDTGDDDAWLSTLLDTDQAGNVRPLGAAVDMGAIEFSGEPSTGNIYYVDMNATGADNGNSWENAFVDLNSALTTFCPNKDQIWVAQGTYKPSTFPMDCSGCLTEQDYAFQVRPGVALYGGFAGNETSLDQRNIEANETILSGNIGNEISNADNTHHVVIIAGPGDVQPTIIDGFTIREGNANGDSTIQININNINRGTGAGLFTTSEYSVIRNCKFINNSANLNGGGLYKSPLADSCHIFDNVFSGNSASSGGGLYVYGGENRIERNQFIGGNQVIGGGAGIYLFLGNHVVKDNLISGNTGNRGVGIFNVSEMAHIEQNVFSFNQAIQDGAGLQSSGNSNNTLINNTFHNNIAGRDGGAIYNTIATLYSVNNLFYENEAGERGGAWLLFESDVDIINNTFVNNSSATGGGAIHSLSELTVTIVNSIFSGNRINNNTSANGSDIWWNPMSTGTLEVSYSMTQQNSFFASGTGILNDVDPGFLNAEQNDFRLLPCAGAVNAGDLSAWNETGLTVDLNGEQRPVGPSVDMGAFEMQDEAAVPSRYYVNSAATGNNTGLSWEHAFTDLHSALNDPCGSVSEIWVASGVYKPSEAPEPCNNCNSNRHFAFQIKDNISVYGGFGGSETSIEERDLGMNTTILSGDIGVVGNAEDNVFHVVISNSVNPESSVLLDGFTIVDGNANNSINTSIIDGVLTSHDSGGGVYFGGANRVIRNCIFTNNNVTNLGGGGYFYTGNGVSINNLFYNNSARFGGGGLGSFASNLDLVNNTFVKNACMVASGGGGYFSVFDDEVKIYNNIFRENEALGNPSANGADFAIVFATELEVENNITQTWNEGNNFVGLDPLFVDPENYNYRLQVCSPALNAGNNAIFENFGITTDLDNQDRIFNDGIVDIGAYELQMEDYKDDILYVDASASGMGTGFSWDDAFTDLQDALDFKTCSQVTEIWVASGTYYPSRVPDACTNCSSDRDRTFFTDRTIAIYGGFAGNESALEDRDLSLTPTILSGDIGEPNDPTDNAYHVFISVPDGASHDLILDGLTVRDGQADGEEERTFYSETISQNEGAGIYFLGLNSTIRNCILRNNQAETFGGGALLLLGNYNLYNNLILNNSSSFYGGIGSIFTDLNLVNNTFVGNEATGETAGGGFASIFDQNLFVANNIFNRNTSQGSEQVPGADIFTIFTTMLDFQNNITQTWNIGSGNLVNADPLFVDAENDLYRLQECSPGVNAGSQLPWDASGLLTDIEGSMRPFDGGMVDIGAYEYQGLKPELVVICKDTMLILNEMDMASILVAELVVGSAGCGPLTFNIAEDSEIFFDCDDLGEQNLVLTATDVFGETETCAVAITISEEVPPTFDCLEDMWVQLDENCEIEIPDLLADLTGTDNCGDVTFTQSPMAGFQVGSTHLEEIEVLITADDGNGNTATCTVFLTAEDVTPPQAVCQNTTVTLSPQGDYELTPEDVLNLESSIDNCSETTQIDLSQLLLTCADVDQSVQINVTVTDQAGNSSTCVSTIAVVQGADLPAPWVGNSVNNVSGLSTYNPCDQEGVFTLSSTGFAFGTTDAQQFTHQTLCGDGSIIARVSSLNGGGWAGVQIRETLAAGSKKAVLKTQLTNHVRREIRAATNGMVQSQMLPAFNRTWLRLDRSGNTFTGYHSTNGTNWQFAFSANVSMNSCAEIGLIVESINASTVTTGTLESVVVTRVNPPRPIVNNRSESGHSSNVHIFPNPTDGPLQVDLGSHAGSNNKMHVVNTLGQIIDSRELSSERTFYFDLNLIPGIYTIIFEDHGTLRDSHRLIVH